MKIFLILCLLIASVVSTAYGSETNVQNDVYKVRTELLKNISDDDYGGYYTALDGIHIKPIDTEMVQEKVEQAKAILGCPDLSVIIDKPAKYSIKELTDAKKKIHSAMPEMDNITIIEEDNCILVKAIKWSEYKKQKVREVAGIDHVVFDVFSVNSATNRSEQDYSAMPIRESYASEEEYLIDTVDAQTRLQIFAGKLWINRKKFDISSITVSQEKIEVAILGLTKTKRDAVLAYAGEFADAIYVVGGQEKFNFETLRFNLRKFVVFEGKNYLEYGGMLFVIKNKPYVKDSYLMMPVRDIYCIINKVSDLGDNFSIRWIGGDKKIVELLNGSGTPIHLSLKENKLIWPESRVGASEDIEGTVEQVNNTIYVPYSPNNILNIFLRKTENTWYANSKTVSFEI